MELCLLDKNTVKKTQYPFGKTAKQPYMTEIHKHHLKGFLDTKFRIDPPFFG